RARRPVRPRRDRLLHRDRGAGSALEIRLSCIVSGAASRPLRARAGAPKGIRTPDLHLERVASWASRRWGRRGRSLAAAIGLPSPAMEYLGVRIPTIVKDNVAVRCEGCLEVIEGQPWRLNILDAVATETPVSWAERTPINPGPFEFHGDP